MSLEIPKDYNHENEAKWQKLWRDNEIHKFIGDGTRPRYVIDTPPPYPTGSIHMGHVLNWVYIDMIARNKRMNGFDVLFPQGWDCHGLPTEVKVEETQKIKKNDVSREEFRQMCVDLTSGNIAMMKNQMQSLGFSQDWSREFVTMTPEYMKKTQLSFLEMHSNDLIYQGIHPVNWCPRCETAIAFAEVEYSANETFLNYVNFNINGDGSSANGNISNTITIATTRPELMAACVAILVHKDDERYGKFIGKEAKVPIFGQNVKILGDSEVDPEFGTGAVMVCTFGDKTDVSWVNEYDLDIIEAIDEQGIMTSAAGPYEGLTISECKKQSIEDLEKEGYLLKKEKVDQNVGQCWRCNTPIEILVKKQWFVAVSKLVDDTKKAANSMKWVPEHMESRLINWADSMQWDWCISRQRIFATPIPVWYCNGCGKVKLPKAEELPIDPTNTQPSNTCECGSNNFTAEEDVLDTWMDSSISPLSIVNWPDSKYAQNFPANLRPQGHDIIRTWAFYTTLRTIALTGIRPFDEIMINGMVFGEDGYKMSKSRGNVIAPDEVIVDNGADALRIWAANSAPGADVPFAWKDVQYAHKFLRKFWNAFRFISIHIFDDDETDNTSESSNDSIKPNLEILDQWILSKLNQLIIDVTDAFDSYNFAKAINPIQKFVWHDFCDEYIESVKYKLYNKETDEKSINSKIAAKYTLKTVIETSLKLLAPITPHFADEVYQYFNITEGNVNNYNQFVELKDWPKVDNNLINSLAEKEGELIIEIIAELRRFKSAAKMPLNAPISSLTIYNNENTNNDLDKSIDISNIIKSNIKDIQGTLKINDIEISSGKPDVYEKVVEITPDMAKIGPMCKGDAPKVVAYLQNNNMDEIAKTVEENGEIEIEGHIITEDILSMKKEVLGKSGEKVDIIYYDGLDLIFEIVK
ncbi:MAG: valine--tRNA ligase [Methanobacteriaceae archaeon]